MGSIQPKKRILNFRLTEDEYHNLQEASSIHGARSLSDFAGSILLHSLASGAPPQGGTQVERRLSQLEASVLSISQTIRALQFPK